MSKYGTFQENEKTFYFFNINELDKPMLTKNGDKLCDCTIELRRTLIAQSQPKVLH